MRIYIAGPMTGIPEFNYPAFHTAKADLLAAGFEVRSPADHALGAHLVWADYMRKDIPWLLECDAVAVLPGWEGSRGASLEIHIARALEMPVRAIEDWLDDEAAA